jgi:hypothetical protein
VSLGLRRIEGRGAGHRRRFQRAEGCFGWLSPRNRPQGRPLRTRSQPLVDPPRPGERPRDVPLWLHRLYRLRHQGSLRPVTNQHLVCSVGAPAIFQRSYSCPPGLIWAAPGNGRNGSNLAARSPPPEWPESARCRPCLARLTGFAPNPSFTSAPTDQLGWAESRGRFLPLGDGCTSGSAGTDGRAHRNSCASVRWLTSRLSNHA